MAALQLVCSSGPLCTADLAKSFFFSVCPLVNKVAFSSFLFSSTFYHFSTLTQTSLSSFSPVSGVSCYIEFTV